MKLFGTILILLALAPLGRAQSPDPALMTHILSIRAIDNHSHPPSVVGAGEHNDDYDALPCDPLEPTEPNTMTRPKIPNI